MDWRNRKKPLMGLIGGIGVVLLLAGVLGVGLTLTEGILAAFAVWIVGATLINVLIVD